MPGAFRAGFWNEPEPAAPRPEDGAALARYLRQTDAQPSRRTQVSPRTWGSPPRKR